MLGVQLGALTPVVVLAANALWGWILGQLSHARGRRGRRLGAVLPSLPCGSGVISDTHDNARNVARMVEVLRAARVERVIHTGDITRPATLRLFGALGVPLFGVYGNNDREREPLAAAAARARLRAGRPAARAPLGRSGASWWCTTGKEHPELAARRPATSSCTGTTTASRSSA